VLVVQNVKHCIFVSGEGLLALELVGVHADGVVIAAAEECLAALLKLDAVDVGLGNL